MATPGREHGTRRHRAPPPRMERWAIGLAGGDGTRLRGLTRRIAGDDRPKLFCSLLSEDTLLGKTRRRVALGVSAPRTFFSVTSAHEDLGSPDRVPALRLRMAAPWEEIASRPVLVAAAAG
jgi:mannose-1-phosphate guanylyltransferase